jgi:hypothetical protein
LLISRDINYWEMLYCCRGKEHKQNQHYAKLQQLDPRLDTKRMVLEMLADNGSGTRGEEVISQSRYDEFHISVLPFFLSCSFLSLSSSFPTLSPFPFPFLLYNNINNRLCKWKSRAFSC